MFPWLLLPLAFAAGVLAGALSLDPGVLEVRLTVDEVDNTTLMLDVIVLLITSWLANPVIRRHHGLRRGQSVCRRSIWLPPLPGVPGRPADAVVAVVFAGVVWLGLVPHRMGAELRAAGSRSALRRRRSERRSRRGSRQQ